MLSRLSALSPLRRHRASGTHRNANKRGSRPRLEPLEQRMVLYSASGNAWPSPQLITLSFVPDGTKVNGVSSNLFATFNAKYGSAAAWENIVLKAAQSWAAQTDINFAVVTDNGTAEGQGSDQQGDPGQGDIRFGGYNFNSSSLAQALLPPPVNNFSGAGDVTFNTGAAFGTSYDLYTVAVHEIGHALGLYHSGIASAEMYSSYNGTKPALNSDDVAGARAIYSAGAARDMDQFEGNGSSNNTFATATNLTPFVSSSTDTGVVTNVDINSTSDADYYLISGSVPTSTGNMTLTLQTRDLSLLSPSVTVYAADQTTVLASVSASGTNGTTLSVGWSGVGHGSPFYVKVTGADSSVFGTGSYAMALNTGTNPTPAIPLPNTTLADGSPTHTGGGQAVTLSTETRVNTTTPGVQSLDPSNQKAVAMDAAGNFVVTWQSQAEDGSGWGVYAQRYNAAGVPQGSEFRVNSTTTGDQMSPAIAMDAAGDFVIAWQSQGQDGSGWGIYARRYNALGILQGGEFRVNSTTNGDQTGPSVAMDGLGNFIVAWTSNGQDGSGKGVYAQRYSTTLGLPLLGEFRVNTTTAGDQTNPSVAMDSLGNFTVTWASQNQDGSGWGVYAQQFLTTLGLPSGGEFQVNTDSTGDQTNPNIAMDKQGDFTIAWQSNVSGNAGIFAQRFDSLGNRNGGPLAVNTDTTKTERYPAVAVDDGGDLLVTWIGTPLGGSNGSVYAQQFTPSGVPLGGAFTVNTSMGYPDAAASVTLNDQGQVVAAWSGGGPTDPWGVYMQRFTISFSSESSDTFYKQGDPNDPDQAGQVPHPTSPVFIGPMPVSPVNNPAGSNQPAAGGSGAGAVTAPVGGTVSLFPGITASRVHPGSRPVTLHHRTPHAPRGPLHTPTAHGRPHHPTVAPPRHTFRHH